MRRTLSAVFLCVVVCVIFASRGSATPRVLLVSPALAINSNQRLECAVVNADDSPHDVVIRFKDSNGNIVSGNPAITVAPGGSTGISFPSGFGANHCEITADGSPDFYRASIDVIDTLAPVQPAVVVALPIR